jgi:crotonobetainyl-CoA:carnitine CoA-transferase CaiB-like acyl-CoA transferase
MQLVRGRVGSNKPRHENVNPYHGFYPTKDDRWIAVNFGRAKSVGEALGHPELETDPHFASFESRRKHNAEVVEVLDGIFRERTLEEWCDRFLQFEFIWAPVQRAADVVADPQAEAAGAFVQIPRKDGKGTYRGPAMPVSFFNDDGSPDGLPWTQGPELGEHTDEILQSIGYDAQVVAALRQKRVIL